MATGYALLCLSLISVMSPYGAGAQAARSACGSARERGRLRYVQTVGLVFLGGASPTAGLPLAPAAQQLDLVLGGRDRGLPLPERPRHIRRGVERVVSP